MAHVIVIGAGYAGVRAAKAARREGVAVTLIDADGRHDFGPRLATVAAGACPEDDAFAPAGELVGIDVLTERVASIDVRGNAVMLASGTRLHHDALVVTVGARPNHPAVPGLDEFGLDLKTSHDALHLRRTLRRVPGLIVAGGGATGVQLAGEVAANNELPVHLVEIEDRLLPGTPRSLSRHAARLLRQRGVTLHLGRRVDRVHGEGVQLDDGTTLLGATAWCGGFRADVHDLLPGADVVDGRLVVDGELRLVGSDNVFVAGDAANHVDLLGRPLGMSAQIAVQAGKAAGRNAALVAVGDDPLPTILFDLGRVITMGGHRGVAMLGPVRVAAPIIDLAVPILHDVIDVRHLFETGGLRAAVRFGPRRRFNDQPNLRVVTTPAAIDAS